MPAPNNKEDTIMSEENYTFENEQYRKTYWHTCSHILAQAVKRLWPEVKLAIGPSIDNGFYYDLDAPFAFTPEHLTEIEAEMRKICKEKLKLERFELPRGGTLSAAASLSAAVGSGFFSVIAFSIGNSINLSAAFVNPPAPAISRRCAGPPVRPPPPAAPPSPAGPSPSI